MHLVQRFSRARMPLKKNSWCWSSSQPFAVQIISLSSINFRLFVIFFSFATNGSKWGPNLPNTMGGEAVWNWKFGWRSVLLMTYELVMTRHTASQLSSSLLFQCRSTFSNQISVVCSCNSCAMFQIVSQYNFFRILEYGGHDVAGWCDHAKLSGRCS